MKTKLFFISAFAFAALVFISSFPTGCTKERTAIKHALKDDTVSYCEPSIEGLWTGYAQNAVSGQPFTVSIKLNGAMTYEDSVLNTQQLCVGTWSLSGSKFEFNCECVYGYYVGVKQKFTADYDSSTGTLTSGTWINTYPPSNQDSGTFTLTKVR